MIKALVIVALTLGCVWAYNHQTETKDAASKTFDAGKAGVKQAQKEYSSRK